MKRPKLSRILASFAVLAFIVTSTAVVHAADPTATARPTLQQLLSEMTRLQAQLDDLGTRLAGIEQRLDAMETAQSTAPSSPTQNNGSPATPSAPTIPAATPQTAIARDVGQSWETDSVALTLDNVKFLGDAVQFELTLENNTRQPIAFNDLHVEVTDNISGQYRLSGCSGVPAGCTGDVTLASGQTQKWTNFWRGPFSDDQVQYLIVTASASRVKNVSWRIPIFH